MAPRRIERAGCQLGDILQVRMKVALLSLSWLLLAGAGMACSGAEAGPAGPTGTSGATSGAAGSVGGGAAGALSGGTSASAGTTAGGSSAGATPGGASGAASGGAPGGAGGEQSLGGAAGASGGGAGGAGAGGACTPKADGAVQAVGETLHDEKTCLDWMKTTKSGVNYAAAEMFCADSILGGFDDWRIPSASEFASTVTRCGKYQPEGPVDPAFDQVGDGYWTTTPAGEPNKVCAVGMLNAGGYYHYGTAGPQVVRCVRGTGTVKMVKDCTVAQGCSNW